MNAGGGDVHLNVLNEYLNPDGFDVVGAICSAREVRQVELDLVPSVIQSHWHRTDERSDPRCALVVTRTKPTLYVLIVQYLHIATSDHAGPGRRYLSIYTRRTYTHRRHKSRR